MHVAHDLIREIVPPDTFRASREPRMLFATLVDSLALCVHDEAQGSGGLLHLRFVGGRGRPADATDVEFNSLLAALDRFKTAVLGDAAPGESVQARIVAHEYPAPASDEPDATFVDLVKADLIDAGIECGSQTLRRHEPVYVCFQPHNGRMRLCTAAELPG